MACRFMRSHTREHQSILDPTGRLPVPPSEATLVKRWDFGMGTTATDELVAQYRQLHPEVEAADVLLPRSLRCAAGRLAPTAVCETGSLNEAWRFQRATFGEQHVPKLALYTAASEADF